MFLIETDFTVILSNFDGGWCGLLNLRQNMNTWTCFVGSGFKNIFSLCTQFAIFRDHDLVHFAILSLSCITEKIDVLKTRRKPVITYYNWN